MRPIAYFAAAVALRRSRTARVGFASTYGHSGFFPGYLTEMRYYAESGVAVAVQANTSDQRAIGRGLGTIAHRLAERAIAAAPRE
jgi:hypothetical protein